MIIEKSRLISLLTIFVFFMIISCSDKGSNSTNTTRKNTIHVNLGIYTPGTKLPLGPPLEASKKAAEKYNSLHPETTVKFVYEVTRGSQEGEWLKTQLVGGIAPDIINQNAEITWPDVSKDWYIPLDEFLEKPNPYIKGNVRWMDSFINKALMNAKRAPDGKLYCVSIDIVETAVFYNKTLFEKYNLSIPETWGNFIKIQEILLKNGIIPFTAEGNLGSDWGQDIIFDMLYSDIIKNLDVEPSMESQSAYMEHYLTPKEVVFLLKKGFFTKNDSRWREMNKLLKDWRKYWAKELKNTDVSRLFITQRVAMLWNGSWFIRRLAYDPYIDFEWGVFYLPAMTKKTSEFASGTKASVIGGSAIQLHVTNSAKTYNHLDRVIDFLMFLTAPQNFGKILNEAMMFLPNIKEIDMPEELTPFKNIFNRRYCSIKWLESFDPQYKGYWRRMLDLYLHDGITLDDFLERLENNFNQFGDKKIAEYNWDFTEYEKKWQETGVEVK